MKFFSYDPEDGFSFHTSEAEAKKAAEDSLECYRDVCSEGWPEEVESVCWGTVQEIAGMTNKRVDPSGHFDYLCDYELHHINTDDSSISEELALVKEEFEIYRNACNCVDLLEENRQLRNVMSKIWEEAWLSNAPPALCSRIKALLESEVSDG